MTIIVVQRNRLTVGVVGVLAAALLIMVSSCTAGSGSSETPSPDHDVPTRSASSPSSPTAETTAAPTSTGSPTPATEPSSPPPQDRPKPVSLPAYFDRDFSGGGLRIRAVREQTESYTSYNASYRSQRWRISGVLNVPTGRGPFPAVVLAHGYIDPAVYFRGQGMPRERVVLAEAGYIAFHVDYRNHAASDDDPAVYRNARLGYSVDVINAVNALRASDEIPVDDDRMAIFGRSMGGGVVYRALEMAPGLVDAGVVFAAVSSDERDNFRQFGADGSSSWDGIESRWGKPRENPRFWDGLAARRYADRITEPLLAYHGRVDTTCPPSWARATHRAMRAAGVDMQLRWVDGEGHTFNDPAFYAAMRGTIRFLDRHLE